MRDPIFDLGHELGQHEIITPRNWKTGEFFMGSRRSTLSILMYKCRRNTWSLNSMDFRGCRFVNMNLHDMDFSECLFDDAQFWHCDIVNCDFTNASFRDTGFVDCSIPWELNVFTGANFGNLIDGEERSYGTHPREAISYLYGVPLLYADDHPDQHTRTCSGAAVFPRSM